MHYGGSQDTECLWAGLTCLGDATIVLADGTTNTVTNFNRNYPCIQAAEGKTLVIKGGAAGNHEFPKFCNLPAAKTDAMDAMEKALGE